MGRRRVSGWGVASCRERHEPQGMGRPRMQSAVVEAIKEES